MGKGEKRRKFKFIATSLVGSSFPLLMRSLVRHSFDARYTLKVIITSLVSLILEPFRWYEELVWRRRIKKVKIDKPPVFIIGFWRSGTTMLHNLMCKDPQAAYVTTYQTVFPNHILSHAWWFKPIMGLFFPTHRPFDDVKMGLDLPQEEEIALANLQPISFYSFMYFPKDFEKFYEQELYLHGHTEGWKKSYLKLIRKSMLNIGGRRFISKNPSNMVRIKYLLEMFPDAKFIFIYRNPYKTVESFYRFFAEVMPAVQVQKSNEELNLERHFRVFTDMFRRYFRERSMIRPENLVEIKYEEFRKDPLTGLKNIYAQLQVDGFEEAKPVFEEYLKEMAEYQQHSWEVSRQTIDLVNAQARDILQELDYRELA